MLNESEVLKNEAPGLIVADSLDGLIISGSISSFFGAPPSPKTPFSPKNVAFIFGFRN